MKTNPTSYKQRLDEEFLVRGKRLDDGNWEQGAYIVLCGQHTIFNGFDGFAFYKNKGKEEINLRNVNIASVDPATVGRCTGFKDKNKNLIFDGDIVYISDRECIMCVMQYQGAWMLKSPDNSNDELLYDMHENTEIIGNVHDDSDFTEIYGENK